MDATIAKLAGPAATLGVRGSDVSYGSPEFVADFKEFTRGKNISYNSKVCWLWVGGFRCGGWPQWRRCSQPRTRPAR